jgi:HSP20 family protein
MLVRFDPFRDLDRLSQELWGQAPSGGGPARMAMDAVRHGDRVELTFELPGVDADSIDVEVEKHVLTVTAERHVESERREGEEVLVRERRHGRFVRQVSLGDNLDTDHLEARYHDGVLRVMVPIAEQAKPRKVAVGSGPGPDAEAAIDVRFEAEPAPAEAD